VASKFGNIGIPIAAVLLFVLNVAGTLPGILNSDSRIQFEQASTGKFTDWHPPVMAFLWSLLLPICRGPQPLLVLQQFFHWAGFGLVGDGLSRSGRPLAGRAMLAAGAFPFFLQFTRGIWKDVGLGSAFIAAFGLVFWFRAQGKSVPKGVLAGALILILYGTLVRGNAVFAFAPILIYAVMDSSRIRLHRLIVVSLALALAAIPASSFFNVKVLGAKHTQIVRALMIFDLAGIQQHVGDQVAVVPPEILSAEDMRACYTPITWDNYSPWGECPDVSKRFGLLNSEDQQPLGFDPVKLWISGITHHPIAYLLHRIKHFNSELYFIVPPAHLRFIPGTTTFSDWLDRNPSPKQIALDYLRISVIVWPVFWISAGVCALLLLQRAKPTVESTASVALLTSALIYGLSYAAIGLGVGVRYYYWTIMAILVAIILCFPVLRARLTQCPRIRWFCVLAMGGVVFAGFAARFADIRTLIH
jgi:hypothetical protein